MRISVSGCLSLIGLIMAAVPAGTVPNVSSQIVSVSSRYRVEIALRCGPGYHWVGRHRNRYGAWVPGRCVRN